MTQPSRDLAPWASNTNYSTGPTGVVGTPTKVVPTAAQVADGHIAGTSFKTQHVNQQEYTRDSWILDERDNRTGAFGDGSDGDVTIAGTTTLTRDMYYENLAIEPGGVLATAGYRVFVRRVLSIEAGGQIQNNGSDGGDASGAVGASGSGAPSGSVANGTAGALGVEDGAGVGGTVISSSLGGAGGAGGATTGVPFAGGAGGTATAPAANRGGTRHAICALGSCWGFGLTAADTWLLGGAGGGSGASVAANGFSGGGGGGGGVISIHAHTILIDPDSTPAIQANGGRGGEPDGAVEIGGSGGGGGGLILIAYRRLLEGTDVATATPREPADLAGAGIVIEAAGGAPSNGINNGGNGEAGSPGSIRWWRI